MLSVPEKLRTAAMEFLARVRVGLDIPSRAEVLDLAARIEAISAQMSHLETRRLQDSQVVDELRKASAAQAKRSGSNADGRPERKKPNPKKTKSRSTKRSAAPSGTSKPKTDTAGAEVGPPEPAKRKPRSRRAPSKESGS